MPASLQEQVLRELIPLSFGAPFIFEPDVYRKGSGVREPSDLAWVGRDVVFLFAAQQSATAYDKQVQHNMRQLEGWLRMWALGPKLTGRNEWLTFALEPADVEHIVLVSVVHGEAASMELLPRPPKTSSLESKVLARVAMPDLVLVDLARRGGSAADLADLILRISEESGVVDAGRALALLREQHERAFAYAGSAYRFDPPEEELERHVLQMLLRQIRVLPSGSGAVPDGLMDGLLTFPDLDWESGATLALEAAVRIQIARDGFGIVPWGSPTINAVELGPYRFVIGSADWMKSPRFMFAFKNFIDKTTREDPGRLPITMILPIDEISGLLPAMLELPRQSGVSTTKQALQQIRHR